MLLRVRVSVPDRPGALGSVTRTLGAAGADILQVTVLESTAGRALDEFTISVPSPAVRGRVIAGLDAAPGVHTEGVWTTAEAPDAFPDLVLLGQVTDNPPHGVATLVEAAPRMFSAEWAAVLTHDPEPRILVASWKAPADLVPFELAPYRPRAVEADDGTHLAIAPFEGQQASVVVARREAPPFHDAELVRLTLLAEIIAAIVGKDGFAIIDA